jgi:uncharacterized transporter YbjL
VRNLDYVLDLFTITSSGERERIERFRLRGVSAEEAERLARAYVKNVVVQGKRIDLCAIKTQVGALIKEVFNVDVANEAADDNVGQKNQRRSASGQDPSSGKTSSARIVN